MAYIGTKPTVGNFQICDAISVVNNQAAYTMQVGSVNVIPQSANHMIVSLNGTIQKPNSSFTVSGSTITFASNLVTGDVIDFIQILGDVLDLGVPSDATVTTAKLGDSAVTTAKLNDASVSLAKLTATGTKDATTFLRGDNSFQEVPAGGITMIDNWRLTTSFQTGDANPISSNLERNDNSAPAFGYYGSQMSVSSGIWTFPSTGIYRIDAVAQFYLPGGNQYNGLNIYATANNSSYTTLTSNNSFIKNVTDPTYSQTITNCMLDITDTTNQKIKFRIVNQNSATSVLGDTDYDTTFFRFTRLGDT